MSQTTAKTVVVSAVTTAVTQSSTQAKPSEVQTKAKYQKEIVRGKKECNICKTSFTFLNGEHVCKRCYRNIDMKEKCVWK